MLDTTHIVGYNKPRRSVRTILARADQGQLPKWLNGTDCKSVVFDFGGSNPPLPTVSPALGWPMWRSGSAQSW
jgi:hypothetical protein